MIRVNSNHTIVSSRPSYRSRRLVIRAAIRHTHCLFAYCFSSPHGFSKHAPPVVVYSLLISVSFLVLFYLVSQGVSFLYRIVYQHRIRYIVPSGLAHRVLLVPVSSPGVEYAIAITPSSSSHIPIVFSYPCILVSFIYIAYIIFIIYIHRQGMMSHATISKQAPPPPVPPSQIG